MTGQTTEQLRSKKCRPCEGGVEKLTVAQAQEQLVPVGMASHRRWAENSQGLGDKGLPGRHGVPQPGCRIGRAGGAPSGYSPGRLPPRLDRDLDSRHRWPLGERLHSGGQDRPTARSTETACGGRLIATTRQSTKRKRGHGRNTEGNSKDAHPFRV